MSGLCADRTIIVTGAGGGLGRSYATALGRAGANVVANDINRDTASETVNLIQAEGGNALADTHDITDHEDAGRIVQAAIEQFGDVHGVVNNAGICRDRMFASLNPEDWDAVIAVHMKGHLSLIHI